MREKIDLNKLRMNAVKTASNGVINQDTVFQFNQDGERVWASYSGGKVVHGYLVGLSTGTTLEFRYCQLEEDGTLNGGHSNCELTVSEQGLIQIIEHFEWESQSGRGVNVIQELGV